MTQKRKGPTQGTPARPSKSTEQENAAVSVSDECLEQLRRIAEDAQNFKIRLFHASEDRAVGEWTIFPARKSEWMRKSADSISAYVEGIREIFLDVGAMAKETNKNWLLFKVHLDTLFAAIREIFERAGEGAISHYDEEKRWDSRGAKRAIQVHMAQCELEIRRATTGAFKSAEVWIAQELNRRAQSSTIPPRPSKLPPIKINMSMYAGRIDAANLTDLQREVFLLHLERKMSFSLIAKRLGKDPSTVREHFKAAKRKIEPPKGKK
jgi:hypothetical protein